MGESPQDPPRLLSRRPRGAFARLHEGAAEASLLRREAIFGDPVPSRARVFASAVREALRDVVYLARRPADWHEVFGALGRRLIQRFAWRDGMADAAAGRPPRTVSTSKDAQGRLVEAST